jgi:hypothetical protein
MKVRRADRVRLVANIADHPIENRANDKRSRVYWLTRRWIVIRVSAPPNSATVKWDDRATINHWPMRALEGNRDQHWL